jgi:hypothetical protein
MNGHIQVGIIELNANEQRMEEGWLLRRLEE